MYKHTAKVIYDYLSTVIWLFFEHYWLQLHSNLLLIFSRPFTNAMFVVIAFSHESTFSFLSQYSGESSLCHGHFSSSLVSRSTFCFQFLCSECSLRKNSALFYLHLVWIIITLIILNNFKLFPPKSIYVLRLTKITSYEICFCSRHAGINGKR